MGKTKRKYKVVDTIVNGAAAVIFFHDNVQAKMDRQMLILQYKLAKRFHKARAGILESRAVIITNLTVILLSALFMVGVFSYVLGFEYSYNGKPLGYVKNQDDVVKILDLVSNQLTQEYGYKVNIDEDSDIEFNRVFILDKPVDDQDTVLKRFTYMSDARAEAYGIYVDGEYKVAAKSKENAEKILDAIKDKMLSDDSNVKYESVGFAEKVEIKKKNIKLKYISSFNKAFKELMYGGSKGIVYKVKKGDTFYAICKKFDVSSSELKKMNPKVKKDTLHIGQKIIIEKPTSLLNVKTVSTEKYAEKIKHKVVYKKSKSMYKGDRKIQRKGHDGKRVVVAKVERVNGEKVKVKELSSETIKKSVNTIIVKGTKTPPKTAPTGHLKSPAPGCRRTSGFGHRWGRMHMGIDLAGPIGTPIRAADGGTVIRAGWFQTYGLCVDIRHGNGMVTRYAHNSRILVHVGDKVYQGQQISKLGNTGRSTGPHCHFEVIVNGQHKNPDNYL